MQVTQIFNSKFTTKFLNNLYNKIIILSCYYNIINIYKEEKSEVIYMINK